MRFLFILSVFSSLLFQTTAATELEEVRKAFYQASMKQEVCELIYNKIKDEDYTKSPIMLGYQGVYQAIMAKYAWNPFTKWWYFKTGVNHLEEAIRMKDNSIELIFLRFAVQTNSPSFLGYNENIEKDKAFIMKSIQDKNTRSTYRVFIKDIINYMMGSEYLNAQEKAVLTEFGAVAGSSS